MDQDAAAAGRCGCGRSRPLRMRPQQAVADAAAAGRCGCGRSRPLRMRPCICMPCRRPSSLAPDHAALPYGAREDPGARARHTVNAVVEVLGAPRFWFCRSHPAEPTHDRAESTTMTSSWPAHALPGSGSTSGRWNVRVHAEEVGRIVAILERGEPRQAIAVRRTDTRAALVGKEVRVDAFGVWL